MRIRFATLAFALASSSAIAGPPPNFSQHVSLCNGYLRAKVDIAFGQTGSTASLTTKSGPVVDDPFSHGGIGPDPLDYSVFVAAQAKPSDAHPWTATSAQQDGFVGIAQPDISTRNSTFKSATCQIKGTVILSTGCPAPSGMNRDYKVIERNWVGCGT